jgi:hypothetical protein
MRRGIAAPGSAPAAAQASIKKKQGAEACSCDTKAMHGFAKINAADEFHMTELARLDDGFAAGRVSHPRRCKGPWRTAQAETAPAIPV